MEELSVGRAIEVAIPIIAMIITALFVVSFLLSAILRLPLSLDLSVPARLIGGAIVVIGLTIMASVFKHRSPKTVIVSTYITFTKMFRRVPVSEKAGRTEPLIISGPQKYVRNPLYLGIVIMVLGWAILTAYTFVFIATVVMLLWFSLFLIPFEERELHALFGKEWERYSKETPMLVPFTKRRKV